MANAKFPHDLIVPRVVVPRTLENISTTVTVSNTAVETDLISVVVPANTLKVGSSFSLEAAGTIDHRATAENFNFNVYLGADNMVSTNAAADATARTDKEWLVDTVMTVKTIGSSGLYRGTFLVIHNINVGTATCTVLQNSPATNQGIDTTIDNTIKLTITMVANASNITRIFTGSIEQIN